MWFREVAVFKIFQSEFFPSFSRSDFRSVQRPRSWLGSSGMVTGSGVSGRRPERDLFAHCGEVMIQCVISDIFRLNMACPHLTLPCTMRRRRREMRKEG